MSAWLLGAPTMRDARGSCFVLDAREKLRRLASRLIKLDQDIPRSGARSHPPHARQPAETGFDLQRPVARPTGRMDTHAPTALAHDARRICRGAHLRPRQATGD
jgi:hypothetical protein